MKKLILILLLLKSFTPCYLSNSVDESLLVHVELSPETNFEQIMHKETYTFNVSIRNLAFDYLPCQSVDDDLANFFTGNLTTILEFKWVMTGSYDFGDSTAGYQKNLDQVKINTSIPCPPINRSSWVLFNYTFNRDGFELGVKPFETLSVKVSAYVHYQVFNESAISLGEKIAGNSRSYTLIDKMKINYIEGKLKDLGNEVELVNIIPETTNLETRNYLEIFTDMKSSLEKGNYFSALEIYKDYEDKLRLKFIRSLISETNISLEKAKKTEEYIREIDFLETSYKRLEGKYVILQSSYQRKQLELLNTKQSLTTSITIIFIAAIVFFFFGRRSVKREESTFFTKEMLE
jgi:hypothetical protein